MPTNNDHTPEQEEYSRLIGDLRSMPRVKAPSNLEYLLEQQILASEKPKASWWKRFFLSGFKVGGIRVPVYAYGPVAAVLIVFLGIYVFNVTNFESQLPDTAADQTMAEHQLNPQQDPGTKSPALSVDRDKDAGDEADAVEPAPASPSIPASPQAPRQAPAPTPKPIPTEMEEAPAIRGYGTGQRTPTDGEGLMESTRGAPDTYVAPKEEAKTKAPLRDKMDDRMDETQSMKKSGTNESLLKDAKQSLERRGQYMMMNLASPADSIRILDSLRRLDSLKNLNKQR